MVYTDLCSFYFSVFDEHAVDMTLKEFVELLRGERWKAQVEEYQRLKASGRETEAKKLKRKLAALVIAGRCEGSHAETNLKQWSGDAMLDVDKCNGRVSEFLQVDVYKRQAHLVMSFLILFEIPFCFQFFEYLGIEMKCFLI